jgi:hypothetical protein
MYNRPQLLAANSKHRRQEQGIHICSMDFVEVVVVVAEDNEEDMTVGGSTHSRIEAGAVDTLVDVGKGPKDMVGFHVVADNAHEEEEGVILRNLDPMEAREEEHEDAQADEDETDYKAAPTSSCRCFRFFFLAE